MIKKEWLGISIVALSLVAGCKPRTPAEKAKDAVSDAAHDVGKGVGNAVDDVKDATK